MKRKIIKIDEELCNGCGQCIPECPEGALQIIDGKARLVSDLFCDGLGACLGYCPRGAIKVEEREAEEYDERRVMENVVRQGRNVILAHLEHLKGHHQLGFLKEAVDFLKEKEIELPSGFADDIDPVRCETPAHTCPGTRLMDRRETTDEESGDSGPAPKAVSRLRQWPVQLNLVPPGAPFLDGADLLVAADCVPFAYAGFHEELLKERVVVCGCPKFDDGAAYLERLTEYFRQHDIKSVTVARMVVPCCGGILRLVKEALIASGKDIPLREVVIGIDGERQ